MAVTPHIKVQRGVETFGASAATRTVSITAVGSLAKAFARVTAIHHGCADPDAGVAANRNNVDGGAYAILTALGTVTLTVPSGRTAEDRRVYWEVWEYTGPASGPYEFVVHQHSTNSMGGGATSATNATNINATAAELVPIHCGQANDTATQTYGNALARLDIQGSAPNLNVRCVRGGNQGTTVVAFAAVEFTGSLWLVQKVSHTFAAAGANETETISDVGAWTNAMIVPCGHSLGGTAATNAQDGVIAFQGADTTHVRFRLNTGHATPTTTIVNVAVISTVALNVEHLDSVVGGGTRFTGGGAAPQTVDLTITALPDLTHATAFGWADDDSTATSQPSGFWIYGLTSTTNLRFFRARTVGAGDWALQAVDLNQVGTEEVLPDLDAVGVPLMAATVLISAAQTAAAAAVLSLLTSLNLAKVATSIPRMNVTFTILPAATATGVPLLTIVHSVGGVPVRVTRLGFAVLAVAPTGEVVPQDLATVPLGALAPNWAVPVRLRTTWLTDVAVNESEGSERRVLAERPVRILSATFTALNRSDLALLWGNLLRLTENRVTVPLWTDHARVAATSSGTRIYCDTRDRRFFPGARAAIHGWQSFNRPTEVEFVVIDEVFDDGVSLQEALVETYAEGSRCFPAIDAEVNLDSLLALTTSTIGEAELDLFEIPGESALPTLSSDVPPGFETYLELAIFDVRLNWSAQLDTRYERQGRAYEQGRGRVVHPVGDRARTGHRLTISALDRADAFDVIRFFDYAQARAREFWLVAPKALFEPTAITLTYVDVAAKGGFDNVDDFADHVALKLRDGTLLIRGIASKTDNGTTWRLTFDNAIPSAPAIADILKATLAFRVTFTSDTLEELWSTDEQCDFELEMKEAPPSTDPELDFLPATSELRFQDEIGDLYLWLEASANLWHDYDFVTSPAERDARCDLYPTEESLVRIWDDVRSSPSDPYCESLSTGCTLITFSDAKFNNGRRAVEFLQNGGLEIIQQGRVPWGSGGFTIVLCARLNDNPFTMTFLNIARAGDVAPMFFWDEFNVRVYGTAGVAESGYWITSLPSPGTSDLQVLVVRVTPGVSTQIWYGGGVPVGESAAAPNTMAVDATDLATLLSMGSGLLARDTGIGVSGHHWVNALLLYSRALSDAEVNDLGQHYARSTGAAWSDLA